MEFEERTISNISLPYSAKLSLHGLSLTIYKGFGPWYGFHRPIPGEHTSIKATNLWLSILFSATLSMVNVSPALCTLPYPLLIALGLGCISGCKPARIPERGLHSHSSASNPP